MASSYKKIHIIADANSTAQSAKRLIAKKYKNFPIKYFGNYLIFISSFKKKSGKIREKNG